MSGALAVLAPALIVGVVVALLLRNRKSGGVRERVGQFVSPPTGSEGIGSGAQSRTSRILTRTEDSLERERWWGEFKEDVEIARISRSAIEVVYLTLAFSVIAGALLSLVLGSVILFVLTLIVGPLITRAWVTHRLRHQRVVFAEQLAAHLQELASAMRAGHSMISGIDLLAHGSSEPTRGELQRVIADEHLGMPLEEALRHVGTRMQSKDMGQVALVAELHRQTGGNMAEVLDRVAEGVRERAELNREVRTLTAQARASRVVVTAIAPLLVLFISLVNPAYVSPLFHTGGGHGVLVLAGILLLTGWMVMGRIVRVEA
jgi:tight adherence protein B